MAILYNREFMRKLCLEYQVYIGLVEKQARKIKARWCRLYIVRKRIVGFKGCAIAAPLTVTKALFRKHPG